MMTSIPINEMEPQKRSRDTTVDSHNQTEQTDDIALPMTQAVIFGLYEYKQENEDTKSCVIWVPCGMSTIVVLYKYVTRTGKYMHFGWNIKRNGPIVIDMMVRTGLHSIYRTDHLQ
eukprot:153902_1